MKNYVLILLLILAVYFDITFRKIPNKITMPAILIGVMLSTVSSGLDGFLFSIFGFLLGLTVFLLPYVVGGMGAGDVKLLAAIGALMGWKFTLFSSISTSLVGGILVIVIAIYRGGLINVLFDTVRLIVKPLSIFIYRITGYKRMLKLYKHFEARKSAKNKEYIPYAVAIAIGTLIVQIALVNGVVTI